MLRPLTSPEPDFSDEKPVGEFIVVLDSSGEKATPLEEDPGPPPPPPLPPPPVMEPAVEARCEPEEGVRARDFGEVSDWVVD